jgi:aspartate kinase
MKFINQNMIIVQKFGGTSVGSLEKIKHSASIVKKSILQNKKIVVVVSAIAGQTDELMSKFASITNNSILDKSLLAERDSVVSTGEQVCAGLFAGYLRTIGVNARSFNGFQAGIFTDRNFSNAKIKEINIDLIKKCLELNMTPVITGFQGYCLKQNRSTTLGRGGSDTSAIAIAAALKAEKCEIYKDVDGILTGEPKIIKNYKKIDNLEYSRMIEFSSSGAKVIETRAVQFGAKYNIPINVLSTFSNSTGTLITNEINEKAKITGVSLSSNNLLFVLISTIPLKKEIQNIEDQFPIYKILSIESLQQNQNKFTILLPSTERNNIPNHIQIKIISITGYFLKSDKILNKVINLLDDFEIKQISITATETKISIIVPFNANNEIADKIHQELLLNKN